MEKEYYLDISLFVHRCPYIGILVIKNKVKFRKMRNEWKESVT